VGMRVWHVCETQKLLRRTAGRFKPDGTSLCLRSRRCRRISIISAWRLGHPLAIGG